MIHLCLLLLSLPLGGFVLNDYPSESHQHQSIFNVLSGLRGVVCLMDDVLVYGSTQEEHEKNLLAALNRIQEAGLTLNKEKCVFSKKSIKFLGQLVDE